ncbi:UNVERIFIED_CONTAM: hypothetical protein NCL1_19523 [Trichonephila clavipes]
MRTESVSTTFLRDFDKHVALAASWKYEYLVPLFVNKSSYETTPSYAMIPVQEKLRYFSVRACNKVDIS